MGYMTNGLTFNTLRNANIQRLPLFRDAKGRSAHSKADGSDWSPAQWLQAVVGELGEYANLRKKVERGDMSIEDAQGMLADELADVVIYLDILAFQLGIDLGEAVIDKWNRTSEKVGAPLYIDAEDWHYTSPPVGKGHALSRRAQEAETVNRAPLSSAEKGTMIRSMRDQDIAFSDIAARLNMSVSQCRRLAREPKRKK